MEGFRKLTAIGSAVLGCACSDGGSSGGMADGGNAPIPPPSVTELTPDSGPWGTVVTVRGDGLGSVSRKGVELVLGADGELVIEPHDDPLDAVVSWSEGELSFRFPFPLEGPIAIETPQGATLAGEFTPSWTAGASLPAGPATRAISSVSPEVGVIAVLLESGELLEVGTEIVERSVDATGADLSTAKLYVSESGDVEAIALSKTTPRELVHLASDGTSLAASPTGISGVWHEALLAGAYAWLRDDSGWSRASAGASGWAIDMGPIADPAPADGLRAAAATQDGTLHVVWNVETGDFLDDLEAPYMASVGSGELDFSGAKQAGGSLDDYLTVLELEGRGAGMRLYWCGSDVDPVLGTPAEDACDTLYVSSGGTAVEPRFAEDEKNQFVFTEQLVGAAFCGADGALELSTDSQSEQGEVAVWPCPTIVAVEIDAAGYFLPLVVHGDRLYSPRKRVQ